MDPLCLSSLHWTEADSYHLQIDEELVKHDDFMFLLLHLADVHLSCFISGINAFNFKTGIA